MSLGFIERPTGGNGHPAHSIVYGQKDKKLSRKARKRMAKALAAIVDETIMRNKEKKIPIDADWFRARISALGLTQMAAAKTLGIKRGQLSLTLSGARRLQQDEATAFAALFGAPLSEVMSRAGFGDIQPVPVSGRVLGTGRVSAVIEDGAATLAPVAGYPSNAKALVFEAPTGPLAAWDGAALVYEPSPGAVRAEHVGRLCVIEDTDIGVPVVGVLGQATATRGNAVTVFGTGEVLEARRLVAAHPVLGLHLPRKT